MKWLNKILKLKGVMEMYTWVWLASVGSIGSFSIFITLVFKNLKLLKQQTTNKILSILMVLPFIIGVLLIISAAYFYFYIGSQISH